MLIFAVAMWVLNHYWPVRTVMPEPWSRLGWCVMASAPIAPIAALIQFRRASTTVNPHKPETSTTLVTSGVYAWTRNPMYLGLSILLFGWAIKLGALSPVVGPLLFIPLIRHVQIRLSARSGLPLPIHGAVVRASGRSSDPALAGQRVMQPERLPTSGSLC
jgi:protein-S-isoprenylcysteine O-methyltransferase Ste14